MAEWKRNKSFGGEVYDLYDHGYHRHEPNVRIYSNSLLGWSIFIESKQITTAPTLAAAKLAGLILKDN